MLNSNSPGINTFAEGIYESEIEEYCLLLFSIADIYAIK